MSFEAESNSELTVLVPAYQLHFRFLVQNKIHKQQILSDTRTGILGSIAGPCDFLPARSDEFQKVCTSIIIFPPPSLPPTLCILHFTLRHCAYLVKSFHGLCVLEFCREQNHGHIRIQ